MSAQCDGQTVSPEVETSWPAGHTGPVATVANRDQRAGVNRMPVEEIPNPQSADGNGGGNGGGGGGGGSSNSNSHNRTALTASEMTAVLEQLARTLPG